MRVLSLIFAWLFLAGVVGAQAPSSKPAPAAPPKPAQPASPRPAQAAAAQPYGTLAQVMRGILFPASNVLFDAQTEDPGTKKPEQGSVYSAWQVVENSAIALEEAANLIMIPGRKCENGRPAPVQRADYRKFSQGLVEAGRVAYKAAQSKNQEAVIAATDQITDACLACHEVYRDKGERCVP